MNKRWRSAAERYRRMRPVNPDRKIRQAALRLRRFLGSGEGKDALELLKQSGYCIVLAQLSPEGCAGAWVWFLGGAGLRSCPVDDPLLKGRGNSVICPDRFQFAADDVEAVKAVEAAAKLGFCRPESLLRWIRFELDKIADAAPNRPK